MGNTSYLILIVEVKLQPSWISHTQKPLATFKKLKATISPYVIIYDTYALKLLKGYKHLF